MKKIVSLMLALVMLMSLVACGNNAGSTPSSTPNTQTSDAPQVSDAGTPEIDTYGASYENDEIAEMALGEFTELYTKALEAESISERYALMAIAEAKMLESGIFFPLTSNSGGLYAISRLAPYTVSPALWGNDSDRVYKVVVTEELITSEDRTAMKEYWTEHHGDGTYMAWAKQYLIDKGYTLKDTYNAGYSDDNTTWDILADNRTSTTDAVVMTICNLLEYDEENVLQPALAESYEVSDDGLTYTFHIRQGVKWVDNQGREVADVTADDWVAAMQHTLDNPGFLDYLVDGLIAGVTEYLAGDKDFTKVGVKAVDDYTLQYTLAKEAYYFPTMMGYAVFCPMSRTYYESQGGKFGADYDPSAETYNYGKSHDTIAYCGPYLCTSHTDKNSYVFQANEKYWDYDSINAKTVNRTYVDGTDPLFVYNGVISKTFDSCSLTASALEKCRQDGNFDDYNFIGSNDATSMVGWINLNRSLWHNYNEDTALVSTQDDTTKARTHAALLNQNFRMAIATGLDRATYNAQSTGDEVKYYSLINSYVPGTLVQLPEDITVDINGTPTTFTAGTNFGAITQAQITADGYPMKVYDPDAEEGVGSSAGFDGWYNVEACKDFLAKAVEELAADGLEITAENPIQIDLPVFAGSEIYNNRGQAFKKSIEENTGGLVQINTVSCEERLDQLYAGYYCEAAEEMNYDIYDFSGWGPDFGDPATFLNTLYPAGGGDMLKCIGLEG